MEVLPADSSAAIPTFLECCDDSFRKRALLEVFHILFDMLDRRCADDDSIPVLTLEL